MPAANVQPFGLRTVSVFVLHVQDVIIAGVIERVDDSTPFQMSTREYVVLPLPVANDTLTKKHLW